MMLWNNSVMLVSIVFDYKYDETFIPLRLAHKTAKMNKIARQTVMKTFHLKIFEFLF